VGSSCPSCGTVVRELDPADLQRLESKRKEGMDTNPVFMAAFRVRDYLGDRRRQEAMLGLSRTWKGKDPAADAVIEQFHPLTLDEIRQARELEAYFLQFEAGGLNRVLFVKKNGVATLNPPPDDSLCEFCHAKGWLQKEYRTSKVDGATVAVWLCPRCAGAEPASLPGRRGGAEPQRPRTNLPMLDENPKLLDLLLDALEPAVRQVRQTGSMSPFAMLETLASRRMVQTFRTDRPETGYDEAHRAILAAPPETTRYALAWLGHVTRGGVRYDAILVGGGERGEELAAVIGQRYEQRLPDVTCEPVGNLMVLGPEANLLTQSGGPNAV